jgi:transcriptional regulator with XRE-family HTH domain
MDEAGVTRSELAARLGKTKGYITQLLDGSANMTIRTIADVFLVLGHEFVPTIRPASSGTGIKLQMSFPFSANQFEDDSDGWILKFPETKTERPLHHVQKA